MIRTYHLLANLSNGSLSFWTIQRIDKQFNLHYLVCLVLIYFGDKKLVKYLLKGVIRNKKKVVSEMYDI